MVIDEFVNIFNEVAVAEACWRGNSEISNESGVSRRHQDEGDE